MEALEDRWPDFHVSLTKDDHVMLTAGTTIAFTARTKPHGEDVASTETLAMTWDYEESFADANARLNDFRRKLNQLPDEIAFRWFNRDSVEGVPPPQALISDVTEFDDMEPQTSLFGCGGGAPVSLSVGREKTHIVVDHRLHDPNSYLRLVQAFRWHLGEALC